jgi:hypothetical protein
VGLAHRFAQTGIAKRGQSDEVEQIGAVLLVGQRTGNVDSLKRFGEFALEARYLLLERVGIVPPGCRWC